MTVADRIRKAREEQGMTQEELAHLIGAKNRATVCQIERAGDDVSIMNIRRCAEALKISPKYVLGYEKEPERDLTLTDQEREVILALRQADDQARRMALFALGVLERR